MVKKEMSAQDDSYTSLSGNGRVLALPPDVREWYDRLSQPEEELIACLLADIMPSGEFGERWAFLTNRRLLVISSGQDNGNFEKDLELHIKDIEDAEIRDFVASSSLYVRSNGRGFEVARFSLASRQEANDLSYCLKEIARQRKEGRPIERIKPPPPHRPGNRCSKCGQALGRHSVCNNCVDRRKLLVRLFSYIMPYKWIALLTLVLMMILTGLELVPPYLTKVLVDDVIGGQNISLLTWIVALLAGAYIGRAGISMIRAYTIEWLGNRVLFDMRTEIFNHLQLLHLRYYNQKETGQIMSRVTSDLTRLQNFITEGIQDILVNIMTMFFIAGILMMLNMRLFLLALAPVPVIVISTVIFGHRVHMLYHRIWRRIGGVSAILADTIPGIRVVKAFVQERRESKKFERQNRDLFVQQMRAAKITSAFFPFLGMLTGIGSILIFSAGGYMVLHGQTTLGVLMAFTGYMWRFYMPIQQFGRLNHRLQHCMTSAERVFEILDTDTEPLEATDGKVLTPVKGRIEFKNVKFSYEPGRYALDDVSFTVEPGEMIGLVGPSGAGKSTLVHLICRFYEVDDGAILVDGHDIRDLNLRAYREQIGVVLQDPYLFHGSIWANIAYAKPNASPDEIIAAAKAANSHEFIINLPDGYDTMIGERGMTLSGGERQRISIARAILCNPRILILDEATASVDTETEALIQAAIERLVENRTTFAIAHRLSTLRKASRLIVLERGKLVEIGTHSELIEYDGLFAKLCKMQSEMSKMRAW